MKYSASLKFRSVGGKGEYRWRRRGRRGIAGKETEAKAGRYKKSTPIPKKRLALYKKKRKY